MYFNYHAKAKKLISSGDLIYYTIVDDYNGISPALVLYFKSHKPMPIRKHKFDEYLILLNNEKFIDSKNL